MKVLYLQDDVVVLEPGGDHLMLCNVVHGQQSRPVGLDIVRCKRSVGLNNEAGLKQVGQYNN